MTSKSSLVMMFTLLTLTLGWFSCQTATEPVPRIETAAAAPMETVASPESTPAAQAEPVRNPNVSPAARPRPERMRVAVPTITETTVVARVADQEILGGQLRERWLVKLQPDPDSEFPCFKPVDPNEVLMEMIGEIVLAGEGRNRGLLENDFRVKGPTDRKRTSLLVNAAAVKFVVPRIEVSDEEVKAALAENAKLTEAQARMTVERSKGKQAFDDYVKELKEELQLKIHTENFAQAAALYQRLLEQPRTPRPTPWISNLQMRTELSTEEKALVLASFTGGEFTVASLFNSLDQIVPPSRPRNLNSSEGIGQFVDKALPYPMVVAAAQSAGLDKEPEVAKAIRDYEDRVLYGIMLTDIGKAAAEPTDAEIAAAFARVKGCARNSDMVTAEVLWCHNRGEADRVVQELNRGKDVRDVRAEYSLDTEPNKPVTMAAGSEGRYWDAIWAAEPNAVAGPLLGFRTDGPSRKLSLKWRVLKILSKTSGPALEFDDNTKSSLKWLTLAEHKEKIVAAEVKKLLDATPHEIHPRYLNQFDPERVP